MIVKNNTLSDISKIFIYPSNRKFYTNEFPILFKKIEFFLDNFDGIDSFFEIKYQRFIIIIVSDETPLSLDQNDKLIIFILSLEAEFKVSLIDKVNVCFKQGEYVQLKEIPKFKKLIKNKGVSKKTIVFDNLINTKSDYENYWEMPAGTSWISHFF
ncbi:MAG: ABC transporter ATPase [Flavobacteriaceae bacterium]|nr:ABC transporter ATPase [Flavobacteriaceae bacterium]